MYTSFLFYFLEHNIIVKIKSIYKLEKKKKNY